MAAPLEPQFTPQIDLIGQGSIDGNDQDYVLVTDSPSLRFSTNFSILSWVYPTNPKASTSYNIQSIISKFQSDSNAFALRLRFGKLNLAGGTSKVCSYEIQPEKWTLIVVVIQENTARLFSDSMR